MFMDMASSYDAWFEKTYPRLSGFGLWLRGGETNTLSPEEYGLRPFRVLIARLSTAADTAESSTHKLLYALMKSIPGVFPDLAALPPKNDARLFDRDGVPWLLGTNTKRGPDGFDVIAFSNSIVQEMVNLPVMLQRSGIPLEKSKRMADESAPLVLLGGANALWTSAFWTDDPPVDGVFAGESPGCVERLFFLCRDAKQDRLNKRDALRRLESVPGFFEPDRMRKTRKHHDMQLKDQRFYPGQPVSFIEDQPGRGTVAISEGCPSFCGFCGESFVRKPYRELPAGTVIERAMLMKAAMGLEHVELSSFNFNVHRKFYGILGGLAGRFDAVGLKSMRFDVLARDPGLLPAILAAGKNSITCGLEGISPRLRAFLNKSLSDVDLTEALRAILGSPVRELKVFLIATGLEQTEDVEAFGRLLRWMRNALSAAAHRPRIVFSATPLVRFSWTPLEFDDAPPPDGMRHCLESIEKTVAASKFEFRMAASIPEWWLSQVLARASDSRLWPALLRSIQRTGFVYYRDVPASFTGTFGQDLAAAGVRRDDVLSGANPDAPGGKPWDRIETGVSRSFLAKQHRIMLNRLSDSPAENGINACSGPDGAVCPGCGACPGKRPPAKRVAFGIGRRLVSSLAPMTKEGASAPIGFRSRIPGEAWSFEINERPENADVPAPEAKSNILFAEKLRAKRAALKSGEKEIRFLVRLSGHARGLPRNAAGTALARAFMLADPFFVEAFRRFKESYWENRSSPAWIIGDDIITLVFRGNGSADLKRLLASPEIMEKVNREFKTWGRCTKWSDLQPENVSVLIRSRLEFDANSYLKNVRLNAVLRKSKPGSYRYDFTKEALRKNIIKSMSVETSAGGTTMICLTTGLKFDPAVFAKTAFILPHPADWVRIEMESAMNWKLGRTC